MRLKIHNWSTGQEQQSEAETDHRLEAKGRNGWAGL